MGTDPAQRALSWRWGARPAAGLEPPVRLTHAARSRGSGAHGRRSRAKHARRRAGRRCAAGPSSFANGAGTRTSRSGAAAGPYGPSCRRRRWPSRSRTPARPKRGRSNPGRIPYPHPRRPCRTGPRSPSAPPPPSSSRCPRHFPVWCGSCRRPGSSSRTAGRTRWRRRRAPTRGPRRPRATPRQSPERRRRRSCRFRGHAALPRYKPRPGATNSAPRSQTTPGAC
mmetsp:Transcript_58741/g.170412  ORF Transcript_58741/g.170412 Transcript_58741/m.170412 type:complete len:225 (-) Transcript_58741:325-999(-)